MNLNDVLVTVNKAFRPRKTVNFDEYDLQIDLEPLTSIEEVKVLESIKDYSGAEYMSALKRNTLAFAIKRINDINLDGDEITYPEGDTTRTKSKFLFMTDYLSEWPSLLIESIFDAFSNIMIEVEDRLNKTMKFEKYQLTERPTTPEEVKGFRKIVESDVPETPVEKLNKEVEREINQADEARIKAETEAIAKQS